jgi:DNA end-binding protein Ku
MAARANSSATISFGLVSIPVKVYTANRSKSVSFNMLHAKDKSRLKQQYVCGSCGEPVDSESRVKGFEYARDQYVVMSDEELRALERKSDRTIEIEEFIPMERVDALYYERAQLLGPDKGGAKAYRLLNEAMLTMGKVAIGRHHVRGREQLVLIRPLGRGLVLQGLYYADEVAKFDEIEFGDEVEIKRGELDLAQQLIEQLASERFTPEKYEDEYRRELLAAIDRKVAGQEVVSAPKPEQREQIIDLVAALKKSLEEKRGAGPARVTAEAAAERVRKPARAKGKGGGGAKRASG